MTPLLDLARKFDAVDLTECSRRLAAGESFDDACNAAIGQRHALGEELKLALGDRIQEFEQLYAPLSDLAGKAGHPQGRWRRPDYPHDCGPAVEALTAMGLVTEVGASGVLNGLPIQYGMPASSANVIIGLLEELADGTDGSIPVHVLVGGRKLPVLSAELRGEEIVLQTAELGSTHGLDKVSQHATDRSGGMTAQQIAEASDL